jgi:hypothetical protein
VRPLRFVAAVAALALAAACGSSNVEDARAPAPPPPPRAVLPATVADFAPSHARVILPAKDVGATLADVDTCENCHADVAAQWRTSAHAFASFNNPIYRTSVDRLRKERGVETSRFCGGCHDVALLFDGAMERDIAPKDLRAHAGITCRTCHGIARTRLDGNASFDLDVSDVPLPADGDQASVERHKQRAAPAALRTAAMCGACHRAFLDATTGNATHLVGQDDYTPWSRSEYAGSRATRLDAKIDARECRDCHMQKEEATRGDRAAKGGKVASHRFLGAHTWLAAMRGDAEQVKRVEAFMAQAVTIDIASIGVEGGKRTLLAGLADPEPFRPAANDRVVVDVVVRNRGVGHRFPGGVMDAQDAWIELVVEDAKGRRLGEAGQQQEATGSDLTAHRFTSAMIGGDGVPLLGRETHLFRANAYNHTIPPRDAEVVQYAFDLPPTFGDDALPLRLVARLRHRTRNLVLQRAACVESKSDRSRAFGREGLKRVARNLDPCAPQPVVELGRAEASAGGAPPPRTERSWERQIDHGLALLRAVQERLDDARPVLELARDRAPSDRERAIATWALAQLAASQGRTDDALGLATAASALAPGHPAVARVRGEALATQWRWLEAAPHLGEAAVAAPKDDAAWSRYAVVLGGASKHRESVEAARRALALQPRDADALRVQAMGADALGAADRADAMQAYLDRRTPDDAPGLRNACNKGVPGCVLERSPVHVHVMRK